MPTLARGFSCGHTDLVRPVPHKRSVMSSDRPTSGADSLGCIRDDGIGRFPDNVGSTLDFFGSGRVLAGRFGESRRQDSNSGWRSCRPLHDSHKLCSAKGLRLSDPVVAEHLPNDTCQSDPYLAAVVAAWTNLPEPLKAAIMAMVSGSATGELKRCALIVSGDNPDLTHQDGPGGLLSRTAVASMSLHGRPASRAGVINGSAACGRSWARHRYPYPCSGRQ